VVEHRISNAGRLRYVELLAARPIAVNGAQNVSQFAAHRGVTADPVQFRAEVEVVGLQGDARGACRRAPQSANPVAHSGVGCVAMACFQHCRHHAEQLVIPVMLPLDDARMVILQKPPRLAEQRQALDLGFRELVKNDARATVELVVQIECGLGPLGSRRLPNGSAVHE
jgi:hypothetical protein